MNSWSLEGFREVVGELSELLERSEAPTKEDEEEDEEEPAVFLGAARDSNDDLVDMDID